MSLLNFARCGKKKVKVIHFDHGTPYGKRARNLVEVCCLRAGIVFKTYTYNGSEHTEYAWAEWRNNIMQTQGTLVLTAHHEDDSLESYLMRGSQIALINGNILRPFINAKKSEIVEYAQRHRLIWLDDPTNLTSSNRRSKIRNELIPLMRACGINPYNLTKGSSHESC